ncbi:hypothetical protein ES702_07042 [subsurface metagenome]
MEEWQIISYETFHTSEICSVTMLFRKAFLYEMLGWDDFVPHDEVSGKSPKEEHIRSDVLKLMHSIGNVDFPSNGNVVCFHEHKGQRKYCSRSGSIQDVNKVDILGSDGYSKQSLNESHVVKTVEASTMSEVD